MTWFSSSANETEAARDSGIFMFLAVSFAFPSGSVYFWTGIGDLVIGANTYLGAGQLGEISKAPDRVGLTAERKTYKLSGTDPSIVPESEIDDSFGGSIVEYCGFINQSTGALVDTPEINWEGRIDSIQRQDGYEPAIIVNAEHRLITLDQVDGWRYTHEHQQRFYAGDDGFSLVKSTQTKEILWGGKRVVVGSTPRGNHGRIEHYGPDD